MTDSRGRLALLFLLAIAYAAAPLAQQTPQVFRGGVDAVSVDAVVTDKQGRPVTDLTAQDFEIRESGKLQTIESFKFVQTDDGLNDSMASREILSFEDQTRETAREDNRLFVIFLDDYHTRVGSSLAIREQLAKWVRGLTPHDLVALTTPLMPTAGITFSRDHDAIAGEVSGFRGRKYDYTPKNPIEERLAGEPPEVQEQFRNDTTVSALSKLAEYMGTLRAGRKTLLYVSEGMTGTMPAGVHTTGAYGTTVTQANPTLSSAQQAAQNFSESAALLGLMHDVFQQAARSNTAIYTLDPRGLVASAYGAEDNVSVTESDRMLNEETDLMRVIADETNGRAIVGRNDPMPDLRQMVKDSSGYYLIGYTSSLAPRDGKFHEIKVAVHRKGTEVRARKGYWAYSNEEIERATAAPKPGPSADVTAALDALAGSTSSSRQRPIVVWLGARRGKAEKALLTFAWQAVPKTSRDQMDSVDHVALTATSIFGDTLYQGTVPHDDSTLRTGGEVTFEAPAGAVSVRAVPQNARNLRLDGLDESFDVPDFSSTAAQVTDPFVFSGRTARDLQQVRAAASPAPTPLRVFARTELLLLRFEAYGPGGSVPEIAARLLNQNGDSIASMPAPTHVDGNSFELEIGLSSFPPGDYIVELSAKTASDTVRRLVALRVTG